VVLYNFSQFTSNKHHSKSRNTRIQNLKKQIMVSGALYLVMNNGDRCRILIAIELFPGLERREYSRRDPSHHVAPLYPQTLALSSPTGGGSSVGIVRSRTLATEFSLVL
jgi:hypothetical protein